MLKFKNKSAFTLIELLVVIAIIGILSTLAVVALQNARKSARDAKRIADIKQIQTALELYFNDNGSYPASVTSTIATSGQVYMGVYPTAPSPADNGCTTEENNYTYVVSGDGNSSYSIFFCTAREVSNLSAGNIVASPGGLTKAPKYYTLAYTAGSNGSITGTLSQSVLDGQSGSAVTAVPNSGYLFSSWSDNVLTAGRTDSSVSSNISVTANFIAQQLPYITYSGYSLFIHPTNGASGGGYGCSGTVTGATSNSDGVYNTNRIISFCPSSQAASYCNNLVAYGFSDWFLPSLDQLQAMSDQRSTVNLGTFASSWVAYSSSILWSSTEISSTNAQLYYMTNNPPRAWDYGKTAGGYFRCVRKN